MCLAFTLVYNGCYGIFFQKCFHESFRIIHGDVLRQVFLNWSRPQKKSDRVMEQFGNHSSSRNKQHVPICSFKSQDWSWKVIPCFRTKNRSRVSLPLLLPTKIIHWNYFCTFMNRFYLYIKNKQAKIKKNKQQNKPIHKMVHILIRLVLITIQICCSARLVRSVAYHQFTSPLQAWEAIHCHTVHLTR